MNTDLEETLRELGPGYREMVARMRRCCTFEPRSVVAAKRSKAHEFPRWGYAVAAAFALAFAISAVFTAPHSHSAASDVRNAAAAVPASPYTLAYGAGEMEMQEIVRTQRPDGSWENDFLTRQNAAALRGVAGASVAYRKALRYLRSRGLCPLTDEELRSRAAFARCHVHG